MFTDKKIHNELVQFIITNKDQSVSAVCLFLSKEIKVGNQTLYNFYKTGRASKKTLIKLRIYFSHTAQKSATQNVNTNQNYENGYQAGREAGYREGRAVGLAEAKIKVEFNSAFISRGKLNNHEKITQLLTLAKGNANANEANNAKNAAAGLISKTLKEQFGIDIELKSK